MQTETLGVLIPFAFFALVFASLYVHLTTRNKERLALIEKGADPELFKAKPAKDHGYGNIKGGLFLRNYGTHNFIRKKDIELACDIRDNVCKRCFTSSFFCNLFPELNHDRILTF